MTSAHAPCHSRQASAEEQEDVDEFARRVQREFDARGAARWQALDQFVIPQRVQRA